MQSERGHQKLVQELDSNEQSSCRLQNLKASLEDCQELQVLLPPNFLVQIDLKKFTSAERIKKRNLRKLSPHIGEKIAL